MTENQWKKLLKGAAPISYKSPNPPTDASKAADTTFQVYVLQLECMSSPRYPSMRASCRRFKFMHMPNSIYTTETNTDVKNADGEQYHAEIDFDVMTGIENCALEEVGRII